MVALCVLMLKPKPGEQHLTWCLIEEHFEASNVFGFQYSQQHTHGTARQAR